MADKRINTSTPVLELSTLNPERQRIKIDSRYYELATPADFGLRDQHWLASRGKRIYDSLATADQIDDDELAFLEETLDEYVSRLVRKIPKATLGVLTFQQKVEILNVFGIAAAGVKRSEPVTPPQSIGESSSPGFKDVTAEIPSDG